MNSRILAIALFVSPFFLVACGDDDGAGPFGVAWTFESGDCASNGVETVSVEVLENGSVVDSGEFACTDGRGDLSELPGGTYSVEAEGVDADGVARAETFGISTTFSDNGRFGDLEFTLFPKSVDVVATWNGCPGAVILPYFITIYNPPANAGDPLTDEVQTVQEGCGSGEATLTNVPPGEYVIELDSRAVTPAVYSTQELTVVAGEDTTVDFNVP